MPITIIIFSLIYGDMENIIAYSILPNDHKITNIPIVNKQSPTLFVRKAEIEL
jgi:hypothetical protein